MNKKGYVRTLEAVFAVLIVFAVIIFITREQSEKNLRDVPVVDSSQKFILDTISNDLALRFCAVEGKNTVGDDYTGPCNNQTNFFLDSSVLPRTVSTVRISRFTQSGRINCGAAIGHLINENIPSSYYYTCEICNSALSCLNSGESNIIPADGRNVHTKTVFLAVSERSIKEKVLRLYFWGCGREDTNCIF